MTLFCIFFLPITQIKVTSKLIHIYEVLLS